MTGHVTGHVKGRRGVHPRLILPQQPAVTFGPPLVALSLPSHCRPSHCPARPGLGSYYEQLEEIKSKMPVDVTQHYDIFLHIYIAGPFGEKRVGYKRYQTKQLLEDKWNKGPQWILLDVTAVTARTGATRVPVGALRRGRACRLPISRRMLPTSRHGDPP